MDAAPPDDLPPPDDLAAPFFWRRHADHLWVAGVFIGTVVLTVLLFPPAHTPEIAYFFAAPALFWAYLRPSFKRYALTTLGAQAVAWTIILGWLHNVTIGGLLLLGPFVGLWVGSWFLAAWWVLPRIIARPALTRIAALAGLAGLWVFIEWTRTWLLGGLPWLPLAASQWQRMAILQIAAFTGAGGVSFILVAMNLGLAAYARQLFFEKHSGLIRRSPEFLAAMFLLLVCVSTQIGPTLDRPRHAVPLGRFAFVQPYIPQSLKWDPAEGPGILKVLDSLTLAAGATQPDVILWPEATTPWAVKGDSNMRDWVKQLDHTAGVPLVLGSIAIERGKTEADDTWFNAVFAVDPTTGVQPRYYAKRKLVPFGEFVPLRPLLGWIGKFVPIGDDFGQGTDPTPLVVSIHGRPLALGTLICYEDIFPALARQSVLAGAEVLTVHTNNGWFGTGGAAYQHAANAVLRAVETRRPVLRCGNGGWSGWIDEFGSIRAELTQDQSGKVTSDPLIANTGTIYFRGTQTAEVSADSRWMGKHSFYVEHGDWFVALCAALAGAAFLIARTPVIPPVKNKNRD
ncbi:MAG TPA: apolipoprotein N-acyltransferase [Rariglobus sp.]|jgi:apolipoprotein N-acyltransferase|nr:apolipoprotein N-acyltransferase [Rariglobus sp.]